MSEEKPLLIQIDNLVREMTDEEKEIYLSNPGQNLGLETTPPSE